MWLAWRQHRSEVVVVAGVLVVLVIILILSHETMAATIRQLGVASCFAHSNSSLSRCGLPFTTFLSQVSWEQLAITTLNLLPILLGMFIGAPLIARELEANTHRMIWMQGVSRLRWLMVKVALVMAACLVAALVLSVLVSWWRTTFDQLAGSLQPIAFDLEGTAPVAYTLYAISLGVAAGAFVRRTVPAMLVTLGGFLALRLPLEFIVRPHYLPPVVAAWDPSQRGAHSPYARTDWVLSDGQWVDAMGRHVDLSQVFRTCDLNAPVHGFLPGDAFSLCTHAHGWLILSIYQPADRFWLFQGIEAAVYVLAAAALLVATVWWLQQRLS
jgi:hypothetical protein